MNANDLAALPAGSVVETGSGIQYTKLEDGYYRAPYVKHASARRLLDPDHSRQPLKLVRRGDERTLL